MKLTVKEIKEILKDEIEWCEKNKNGNIMPTEGAFIRGLRQAIYLIEKAEKEEG